MALDGAGIGLALLFEAGRSVKSMQERIVCYREGPAFFGKLDTKLARLTNFVENIEVILRSHPEVMPHAVLPDFVGSLTAVKVVLKQAEDGVADYFFKTYGANDSSSCLKKITSKGKRLLRAKSRNALLTAAQSDTTEAESKLQLLLIQLCTALKVDQTALKLDQNLRALIEELLHARERFRPAFNAPLLPGNVHLDFESTDSLGNFTAPEADLKHVVLVSTSSKDVAVAVGASSASGVSLPVHGVSGIAGVGKTVALTGLGHDDDIKNHFVDGVLFMKVGANATVGHLTGELCKLMRVTGAVESAKEVQSAKSLADAVSNAAIWFHGKRILFLIDDIWPSSNRPEGYMPELQELLQGSPESRIAISTRSLQIAAKGRSHVNFGARDPCGQVSSAMFLANVATLAKVKSTECELTAARGILQLCSGFPIALAVAGSAVGVRMNAGVRFEYACQMYLKALNDQIALHPGASVLQNAIRLSLSVLVADWAKRTSDGDLRRLSISDLYTSLCVLKNQQFAPVSVFARMWDVSETKAEAICTMYSSMSLARLSTQIMEEREQCGLHIHDLHLDYCRQRAAANEIEREWHRKLLDCHLKPNRTCNESVKNSDFPLGIKILRFTPRKWWENTIPNMQYIREHLSWHLGNAGLTLELGATVLDLRWINERGRDGGVMALKNDFNILQTTIGDRLSSAETSETMVSLNVVSDLIASMASDLSLGIRVLYQAFNAYLFGISQSNEWLHLFLERMKEAVARPVLEPLLSFYRHPVDEQKLYMDLRLPGQRGSAYLSTDFSHCDMFCASGSNHDVAVFNLESQIRVKWLKGHSTDVSVVRSCSNSNTLLSGSLDGSIILWNWIETESPCFIWKGHTAAVSSLSPNGDDLKLFSGSHDGTVRMWSLVTGEGCDSVDFESEVECVASCPTNQVVAVGTRDGRLRCRDWASGQIVYEHNALDECVFLSAQFGPDGNVLVCGNAKGEATVWECADWKKGATVNIPGPLTHIAMHADGGSVLLGSSLGEIRHWTVSKKEISKFNICMARTLNGLSFRKSGFEVIAGIKLGKTRA